MTLLMKGSEVADAIREELITKVSALQSNGIRPTLAILRVGDVADQLSYASAATKRCDAVGIAVQNIILPMDACEETVISSIRDLDIDESVHGILILRPLPQHLSDAKIRAALLPKKDVDGITDASLTGVFTDTGTGFAPCTAQACIEILKHYKIDCTGKRVVVIGRSLVVGKPAAIMFLKENATVTICHTKTVDLPSITRSADIIVAAAGQPECLRAEHFSPGQVVIDVGINWNEEKKKIYGDVKFEDATPIVAAITPVPGGIGTVTTAVLASHVVEAAGRTVQ